MHPYSTCSQLIYQPPCHSRPLLLTQPHSLSTMAYGFPLSPSPNLNTNTEIHLTMQPNNKLLLPDLPDPSIPICTHSAMTYSCISWILPSITIATPLKRENLVAHPLTEFPRPGDPALMLHSL